MNPLFVYLLKVNIAIALFLLFYRLFFSGDTFWKARRIYMVSSVLIAFSYPLFSIQSWMSESAAIRGIAVEYVQLQELVVTPAASMVIPWKELLTGLYLTMIMVLLIRVLIQLVSVLHVHYKSQAIVVQGVKVRKLNDDVTPFSFFGTIYLNPSLHSEEEIRQILTHELTHVRQWHSVDVVLAELLCVLFWLNPFVWILRREIRQNLEYLADDRVVASGVDSRHYQYHLLQLSCQLPGYQLTNKFNISPLKKRIRMMNQPRSSKTTALKYLLIAPLSFSLVVLSNAEALATSLGQLLPAPVADMVTELKPTLAGLPMQMEAESKDEVKQVTTKIIQISPPVQGEPSKLNELTVVGYAPAPQKDEEPVFMVVEEMPQYTGGEQEMFKYLMNSVKYPVVAQQQGIEGRVIVSFVIDRDGKVTEPVIARGVSHELDAEAIRVVQNMPAWKPGKQKGQTVKVKYTLPINFRLQKSTNESAATQLQKNFPVIVVDGEIKDKGFDLNSIKPDDIQEIEVLKSNDDAARKQELIARYGERAADGVILIKMKK
jgi:TonB family protein